MFESENASKSFITGLLTGGLLGGVLALLFAPKSGKEFRKDISDLKRGIRMGDVQNYKVLAVKKKELARVLTRKSSEERTKK